jgi:uncharacterized protein YbaR (Trm112 family)
MNMFFIFGWGHQTREQFDSRLHMRCPLCHNDVRLILVSVTKWFTLFFLPIIPYSWVYFLGCPICSHGVMVDKARFSRIRAGATDPAGEGSYLESPQTRGLAEGSRVEEASSAIVQCPYCSEELELDKSEVRSGRFNCPTCGRAVAVDQRVETPLPVIGEVNCPSCKTTLELDETELNKTEHFCPVCKAALSISIDSLKSKAR